MNDLSAVEAAADNSCSASKNLGFAQTRNRGDTPLRSRSWAVGSQEYIGASCRAVRLSSGVLRSARPNAILAGMLPSHRLTRSSAA